MIDDYYNIKIMKMGDWTLRPADTESWHGEYSSKYFKETFGFGKGTLIIQTLDDGMQHAYFPQHYFDTLHNYIKKTNKLDSFKLAKILGAFYPLKEKALLEVPKINPKNLSNLTTEELIEIYLKNRDWAHKVTVYDQFGWTAEEYWNPIMESILINKHGIEKDSKEYFRVLFSLTKPEEISTTLSEKRDVLSEVIKVKQNEQDIDTASIFLEKKYGFMPVFAYGTPWDNEYYKKQINELLEKELSVLKSEYQSLKNYTSLRNEAMQKIVRKYGINTKDLQIFVDFGLALDTRNEAEYLLSLTGLFLLPIYREISHRLELPVNWIRNLYEDEIVDALLGKIDSQKILKDKGKICGWGFDSEMLVRYNFSSKEAQKLYDHLKITAENLQGNNEEKGKCASTGKIKGPVKILLSPEDNSKVLKGDILITHATTVDYLPAMKRAVAFVTEVGGLTCHAAVVAREFGVPCVVSLKNATNNFKDGDMVEVDANNGIVRKV